MRIRRIALLVSLLLGGSLPLWAAGPPYQPPASSLADLKEFQGRWKVTLHKINGKRAVEMEEGPGFTFGRSKFRWRAPAAFYGDYWIDATTDPKRISMTFSQDDRSPLWKGIYRFEKDKITIVLGFDDYPKQFERAGEKGTKTLLLVLERVRP